MAGANTYRIEVTDAEGATTHLEVDARTEIGREASGLAVADPSVSRRHLAIEPAGSGLLVEDLGSTYGTFVDGQRIAAATQIEPGSTVQFGDSRLVFVARPAAVAETLPPGAPAVAAAAPEPVGTGVAAASELRPTRPLPADYASKSDDGIEVRYRPGSHGESLASSYLKSCRKARRDLAGIGSESWGSSVVVWLVDPFTDPSTGEAVVEGSVIDDSSNEIWMAVSPEAPPEDPHRPMILLFGAALPAAGDLDLYLEGYGLHLAGTDQPDDALAGLHLPPLDHASGDLRTSMALAWVRFLIGREDEETLRQLLASPAGQVEARFQELYGTTSTALEMQWHSAAVSEQADVKTGEFLRLSIKYLKPYKARQAEIFLYMLLSLAFTAAFPFVSRQLFDDALPSGEFSQVATLLGMLGLAFIVSLVAGLRQAYQGAWVSGAVVRDIRAKMFDRLQGLPEAWHGRYQQGDVMSRLFNDVGQVEAGLTTAIGTGIFQALQLVVSAIIMLTVNFWLGVLVLVGAPIVALVYKRMAKGAQERSIAVSEASSDLFGVASENSSAGQVVRMFGLAGRERERFGRAAERLFGAQRRLSLFGGMFGLSVNLIVTLLRLAVMGIGAWLIIEGRFTIGGLVAFLGVMGDVLTPVTSLTTLGQDIQASMGSLMRINEVLDSEPEGADDAGKPDLATLQSEIKLTGVAFAYGAEKRVLDGVDCTIEAGTKVAFVGPSGSGKSTVLRLLMRQWEPEEGAILFDGVDIRTATVASLRDQMGVVFQDPFLFDTTVRENIAMGRPGATEAEIMAAAAAAEIDAFVDNLPRGYDTLVGQRGSNLSGGQRQRVSIARALVRNPSILLLDEATSALDPQTERAINQTLDRVAEKRTVVSITHRLTSVTGYDRIFVIDNGKVVEHGTHEELLGTGGLYAHLWSEQTGAPVQKSAPFDAAAALARVPLFAELDADALAGVAARMRTFDLSSGETIAEGGGRLLMIAAGHGEALIEDVTGERIVDAVLGPGDTFGMRSLLGRTSGAVLRARDHMTLQVLDDEALSALGMIHPEVGERLAGTAAGGVRPSGGRRLSRASIGPRHSAAVRAVDPQRAASPSTADLRRMTGTFAGPVDLQS